MANTENLKPFTKENAKYYGKKGGIKSAEVRAERKSIKEQFQLLLNMPVSTQSDISKLKEAGFLDDEINNQTLLIYSLFEKALAGDTKAVSIIFRIMQETDEEKSNLIMDSLNVLFK